MTNSKRQSVLIFVGWTLLALLLHFGPSGLRETLETFVLDGAGRTIQLAESLKGIDWNVFGTDSKESRRSVVDQRELGSLRDQNRDLLAVLAQLRSENHTLREIPEFKKSAKVTPLISSELISARILGIKGEDVSTSFLISNGRLQGFFGGEFVLDGSELILDQGTESSIEPDQLVTLGRSLLGRTSRVGRWTTQVQPMTDPEFRTAIHLVRNVEQTSIVGAAGILRGAETHCVITDVPGTLPVAVGDLVFTDPAAMLSPTPIYCGEVVEATIGPNDPHWTIVVRPHCNESNRPKDVAVLRTRNRFDLEDRNSPE